MFNLFDVRVEDVLDPFGVGRALFAWYVMTGVVTYVAIRHTPALRKGRHTK